MTTQEMEKFSIYIDHMCHAIGFDINKIRKNQRTYKYYRNYFCAGDKDKQIWDELVELNYALKTSNSIMDNNYYVVSGCGLEMLESIFKLKLEPRD